MTQFDQRYQQVETQYNAEHITIQQQPLSLTEKQRKQNRTRMLDRVQAIWIDGVLEPSIQGAAQIALELQHKPSAVVTPLWHVLREFSKTGPLPPTDASIVQVYDHASGEVLILGEPGAGKTTLLLELTCDLLERARQDESHPMPVVFNLSSWATTRQPLADWLVAELHSKYQVPRPLAASWIEADQVLPLLDGLDEITVTHRAACVEAINAYRQAHGLLPTVVCSRQADYLTLPLRLLLRTAVVIQPLTQEQIEAYLTIGGRQLTALRETLREDADLRTLASTPLMLNVLTMAYQGTARKEIAATGSLRMKQEQVFASYVQRVLARRSAPTHYTQEQTVHWLAFLARQMKQQNQTVFYIEHLQPNWLERHRGRRAYEYLGIRLPGILIGILVGFSVTALLSGSVNIASSVIYALIGGLLGGILSGSNSAKLHGERKRSVWRSSVLAGLISGLSFVLIFWLLIIGVPPTFSKLTAGTGLLLLSYLISGLIVGLISVFLNVILGGRNSTIQPAEIIVWSWRSLWQSLINARHLRNALLVGISVGLSIGLIYGLGIELIDRLSISLFDVDGLRLGLTRGLSYGLETGLSYWLLLGLFHGVSSNTLEDHHRISPNEGIRRSVRNSFLIGLISGCISGIFSMLSYILLTELSYGLNGGLHPIILSQMLQAGLVVGLPVGLLAGLFLGGLACIRHGVLRWLLWRAGSIPRNYPRFLDYAAEHILLRKVGGGYIFLHRLMLDYFANLETEPVSNALVEDRQERHPSDTIPSASVEPTAIDKPSDVPTTSLAPILDLPEVPRLLSCGHEKHTHNARFCSVCGAPIQSSSLE